jgi:hypothetical protein
MELIEGVIEFLVISSQFTVDSSQIAVGIPPAMAFSGEQPPKEKSAEGGLL